MVRTSGDSSETRLDPAYFSTTPFQSGQAKLQPRQVHNCAATRNSQASGRQHRLKSMIRAMENNNGLRLFGNNLSSFQKRLSFLNGHKDETTAHRSNLIRSQLDHHLLMCRKRTFKHRELGRVKFNGRCQASGHTIFGRFLSNCLPLVLCDCGSKFSRENKLEVHIIGKSFQLFPWLLLLHGLEQLVASNGLDGLRGSLLRQVWVGTPWVQSSSGRDLIKAPLPPSPQTIGQMQVWPSCIAWTKEARMLTRMVSSSSRESSKSTSRSTWAMKAKAWAPHSRWDGKPCGMRCITSSSKLRCNPIQRISPSKMSSSTTSANVWTTRTWPQGQSKEEPVITFNRHRNNLMAMSLDLWKGRTPLFSQNVSRIIPLQRIERFKAQHSWFGWESTSGIVDALIDQDFASETWFHPHTWLCHGHWAIWIGHQLKCMCETYLQSAGLMSWTLLQLGQAGLQHGQEGMTAQTAIHVLCGHHCLLNAKSTGEWLHQEQARTEETSDEGSDVPPTRWKGSSNARKSSNLTSQEIDCYCTTGTFAGKGTLGMIKVDFNKSQCIGQLGEARRQCSRQDSICIIGGNPNGLSPRRENNRDPAPRDTEDRNHLDFNIIDFRVWKCPLLTVNGAVIQPCTRNQGINHNKCLLRVLACEIIVHRQPRFPSGLWGQHFCQLLATCWRRCQSLAMCSMDGMSVPIPIKLETSHETGVNCSQGSSTQHHTDQNEDGPWHSDQGQKSCEPGHMQLMRQSEWKHHLLHKAA